MKTVEERAREIDREYEMMPRPEENVAALIRADREAVLGQAERVLCTANYAAVGADQKLIEEVIRYMVSAVRKEIL